VKANQRGLPASWGHAEWETVARQLCSQRDDGSIRFDYDPAIAVPFGNSMTGKSADMWPLFDALALKPVLMVRGELSDLLTAQALAELGERSANVATVTISGVGHAPDLSEPEAVAAIAAFLDRVSI
jgi:pimeloyl-ACP methyl ester carboxylesterase